jgi:hypothetical protein
MPKDQKLQRLLAQAVAAQKAGDHKRARKLLDAAIVHSKKPVVQQQQQIQPKKKV